MSGRSLQQTVMLRNPQGFHLRPKGAVAQNALKFKSDVRLRWDGQVFNGKSMLDLLGLSAELGHEVIVETEGPDAEEALKAVVEALDKFESEEGMG